MILIVRAQIGEGGQVVTVRHGGPFAGGHARYVLRSLIIILETKGSKS